MHRHEELTTTDLKRLLRAKKILFAGNKNLKVYGTLKCGSGKRMKKVNRVFFESEKEAIDLGYRPCGNCMRGSRNGTKTTS
ncbi:MAG TPA: Ada metal-binding domain-containing protein [Cyclobacteriaceae bacterium]|nr:Ada metal-binding domain-containing protein [Cyclobacteriaceae bacterium]